MACSFRDMSISEKVRMFQQTKKVLSRWLMDSFHLFDAKHLLVRVVDGFI